MFAYSNSPEFKTKLKFAISSLTINNNNNNNNNNNYDYSFNSQSNGYYVNNNGDLIIKNINFKNQGWFKCEASNLLGSVSANMFLQVKSKLKFILLILLILVVILKLNFIK